MTFFIDKKTKRTQEIQALEIIAPHDGAFIVKDTPLLVDTYRVPALHIRASILLHRISLDLNGFPEFGMIEIFPSIYPGHTVDHFV
jgi:hypothetical protein